MIKSFRSKPLAALWGGGSAARIDAALHDRIRRRLHALNSAKQPTDMNIPGFDFHRLRGKPTRCSVDVNGPWCITFEWQQGDALRVDLEQYH